jgi:prevent-host-death family protein
VKTMPLAEFKAKLSEHLKRLPEGPVVVTRHGRPAALVINVPENPDDLQSLLLSFSPRFWEIIAASRATRKIPFAEFFGDAPKSSKKARLIGRRKGPSKGRRRGESA